MQEFYSNRQVGGGMMKAEALRKAQLALLQGSARISASSKARKAAPETVRIVTARARSQTRADIVYVEAKTRARIQTRPEKTLCPSLLLGASHPHRQLAIEIHNDTPHPLAVLQCGRQGTRRWRSPCGRVMGPADRS